MSGRYRKSWIPVTDESDFPLQNIPFGIANTGDRTPHVVSRIGDYVIDLACLAGHGYFASVPGVTRDIMIRHHLNDFIALGKESTSKVRERMMELFSEDAADIRDNGQIRDCALIPADQAALLLPVRPGDYTDFYSSLEHASNVGSIFRDPDHPLLPNWRHMPVGYSGRSSSVLASGTPVHRPQGQYKVNDLPTPVFGPSKQLDFELEMAFVTNRSTRPGESISVEKAEDYIFGLLLFNDLTARDIQRWEYVPLGPFLSKSFGSLVSPWIVTLEALEPFRTEGPVQEPEVLPYLRTSGNRNLDIRLEVAIRPGHGRETTVCRTNFRYMYWNMAQQLAHQTVAGCNINPGDLYASGTISGTDPGSYGSLLELTWNGTRPLAMTDGSSRTWLEDGDTVIIRGYGEKDGLRIGFGECATTII